MQIQHRALKEGKEYQEWPCLAARKTLLWALKFVVMGNISVIKFDFFCRRRSWAEVTAAGFEGCGQSGKYLAGQWFLHRSLWCLLCLSQHISGRVWRRRNTCIMGISVPALPGTAVPMLKEQCEGAFVGTGFSKLLLVLPVLWATLKPGVRSAEVPQTQPIPSCQLPPNTNCFSKIHLLQEKNSLKKSLYMYPEVD